MASPKTKLFILLIPLLLIVGCVPALMTPTPIPPLDPNEIITFVAQTAEAAETQTMAAMPPLPATPTFTLTPRSTFTPLPSFTPAQPYIFPSATAYQKLQFYRVKHDNQLAMYNYQSRTHDDNSEGMLNQTPEVVPLFLLPKLTSGTGRTDLYGPWENYLDDLNEHDAGRIRYVKGTKAGLFNTAGFPHLESLTMGGNIVTLRRIQDTWGLVNTMAYGSPPSAADTNYITRPDLVHKFVVVGWKRSTRTTIIVKPPKGDVYWPFVAKRDLWIPMERLEPFPILPMTVTANKDIYIQDNPGPAIEETKAVFTEGSQMVVIGYFPSGSDVWGRLQTGAWIPLLYNQKYLTTWTMETQPPPK